MGNISGTFGPEETKLYDSNSGAEVPGSGVHPYSFMPTFSVDGKMLVFNDVESTSAMNDGHALSVMDFDRATMKFSNKREIFRDPTLFPSWPFFVPDVVQKAEENAVPVSKRVVFALVSNNDLVTGAVTSPLHPQLEICGGSTCKLTWPLPLDRANGRDKGMLYLPYGEPEANQNFVPTVSPIAAGGYLLGVFHQQTQLRQYSRQHQWARGRCGEEDLGRRAGHRCATGQRPQPSRVLPAESRERIRQYPRVCCARAVSSRRR